MNAVIAHKYMERKLAYEVIVEDLKDNLTTFGPDWAIISTYRLRVAHMSFWRILHEHVLIDFYKHKHGLKGERDV
jgi:hypothetical protein